MTPNHTIVANSPDDYCLFISDMHLDLSRPAVTQQFIQTLNQQGQNAKAIYLLGDLFEAWLGDKLSIADNRHVIDALKQLSSKGKSIYIQRGNRDFLYGRQFVEASGATLLPDPCVINLFGGNVLISHGDQLCTDDVAYQRYRKIANNPIVQWAALTLTTDAYKRRAAAQMREASKRAQQQKQLAIMDVNNQAVLDWFEHYPADVMIHGHTHRPGKHQYLINKQTKTRWVLGDWYEQGSFLRYQANGLIELHYLETTATSSAPP